VIAASIGIYLSRVRITLDDPATKDEQASNITDLKIHLVFKSSFNKLIHKIEDMAQTIFNEFDTLVVNGVGAEES